MRSKFFYAVVALTVMFSACNKDSFTPVAGEDDVTVEVKGFQKLGDASGEHGDIAFSWNGITASDFASLPTPPFNNFQQLLGKGITVFRSKDALKLPMTDFDLAKVKLGNGNDPVYLWFTDDAALNENNKVTDDEVLVFYLGVRYKAGNNVIFEFDVVNCIEWCAENGPISLQWKDFPTDVNLGDVTQVRIGPVMPKTKDESNKGKDPKPDPDPVPPVIVCVQNVNGDALDCFELGKCDKLSLIKLGEKMNWTGDVNVLLGATTGQKLDKWIVVPSGETFTFGKDVCNDITLRPVFKDPIKVTILNPEGGEITYTLDWPDVGCPSLSKGDLAKYVEELRDKDLGGRQKFEKWEYANGGDFVEGDVCSDITLKPIYKIAPTVTILDPNGNKNPVELLPDWGPNGACPKLDMLKDYEDYFIGERQKFVKWVYAGSKNGAFVDLKDDNTCVDIWLKPVYANFDGYVLVPGGCGTNNVPVWHPTDGTGNEIKACFYIQEIWDDGVTKGEKYNIVLNWGKKVDPDTFGGDILRFVDEPNGGAGGNYTFSAKVELTNHDIVLIEIPIHGNALGGALKVNWQKP